MKAEFVLAVACCAFSSGCSHSAEPALFANSSAVKRLDGSTITGAEIDATVDHAMRAAKVAGAGIAILNEGRIVYLKGYGQRNISSNLALTPNSIMSAASFSKVAFAYLVMQFVQDGIIDLDQPAYRYLSKPLPDFHNYRDLAGDDRWKKITPRMLLSHTSGFPNWRYFTPDKKLRIYFEPGSHYAYSGEGIDLLQLVVESVAKKPLEDLMQEKVFQPIGMTRSSMVWHLSYQQNHADGYDENGKSLGPQRRLLADAAGSMKTTPRDFALFLQAMAKGQGLTTKTLDQMLSPQIRIRSKQQFPTLYREETDENDAIGLSYGLGWGLYFTPYGEVFFKEGHDDGWRNYCVNFREAKIGMVIMTNSSNGENIYDELLRELQKNSFTPLAWEGFIPHDARR